MSFKLAHRDGVRDDRQLAARPPHARAAGVRHQHRRDRRRASRSPSTTRLDRDQEEVFYVLSGSPTLVIDGEDHPAPAGTFARLDPEHKRTVRNDAEEPASVLIVSAPRSSGYEPMEWA